MTQNKEEQQLRDSKLPMYIKVNLETIFKVLSDTTRLRMFNMLNDKGGVCCRIVPDPGQEETQYGLCVQDFVAHLQLPQSTVSHHLSLLRNAGLVRSVKKGLWVYYYRDERAVELFKRVVESL
ncbi:MAG: metalloregulator ArsR/SmtB family transcription factor [Acidibacillus sp.]|uniref:HTH arsR-type domain-containing protein n=1 Tax=Sulfoacidibacillus ferrooxidans TaxID=2005001 RepID=A0A9X2AEF7_9BACL|nr:metalloregulator ArsR/SmtB family transcription factor [Sulfoacidibacillus ferrooxidans]MCI0183041.1 hypothetical protein [Sulfoacidibacillus ferrooxidans]MCY0892618.1 metalloregulator ArsR/SmtB family transcription factor [Acidibacillus sp.]